jgi:hypothetical protein
VMLVRNILNPRTRKVEYANGSRGVVEGFVDAQESCGDDLMGTLQRYLQFAIGREEVGGDLLQRDVPSVDMREAERELLEMGMDVIGRCCTASVGADELGWAGLSEPKLNQRIIHC